MTISDSDYQEILSEIGFPVVSLETLEFSKEHIEDNFIFPAMREYFTWFPLKAVESVHISGNFSLDFPDEFTYGVVDARIATGMAGVRSDSPFLNEVLIKQRTGSMGMYGTPYDYGMMDASYMERSYKQAQMNYQRVKRLDIDENNRVVTGYSNITGELVITWAKFSDDFSSVPFRRKTEVINLAKSNVLRGFAMLRGQFNSDINVEFNADVFERRAEDLYEKTMNKWKRLTKVAISRN